LRSSAISGRRLADGITRLPVLLMLCGLAIFRTAALMNLPRRAYTHDFSVFYTSAIAPRDGLNLSFTWAASSRTAASRYSDLSL
jgi:hypothetical protein